MNKRSQKLKNDSPLSEEKVERTLHKKSRSLDNHPRPSPYGHAPSFQAHPDQSQHFGTYTRPPSTRSISVPIHQDEFHTVSTERGATRSVHVPHQTADDFSRGFHDAGPYRSASVPPQHQTGPSNWGLDPYGSQKAMFLGGKDGAISQAPPTSQFAALSLDPPTFQGSLHKPSLREPLIMGHMSPPSLMGGGGLRMDQQTRMGPTPDEFSRLMERNPVLHAPTPPRFLQPKCTLTTSGELNETLIRTTKFFAENKIDFRFLQEMPGTQERCCMFECKTYDSCYELRLHVYFYSQEKAGTYLVEFMRRMGDSVHFSGIMRQARIFFGESESPLPSVPSLDNLPALKTPQHDDSTRQAVMTLKGMVESRYLDVKYEGIRGLANMSQKDENVRIMAESGCVDLFVENLDSDVTNVHRCAVTGVANLAHKPTEDSAKVYKQRGVPAILKLIASSNTLEVIRESARALEIICRKLGAQYFRSRDIFDGVSKLMETPDAVVYGYGTRLSKVLERSASVS